MTFRLWAVYIGVFIIFTLIDGVGHASVTIGAASDINNTITFQVDEVSSGSGFQGLVRATTSFMLTTLPKFVMWNFGFLTGDLQIIQVIMIFFFGGLLMVTFGSGFIGLLRRNV